MGFGDIGGTIAGLINSGRGLPTIDVSGLLSTISQAQEYQKGLINALPDELKALIPGYQASMNEAGQTLKSDVANQGQNYLDQISALYGPDSPAAQAAMSAFKQQAYSTLPGTLNATRAALGATGGLGRGATASALGKAIQAPATAVSQNAANVTAQQLQAGQQAKQQALATVNNMNDQVFQQLFGMSKDMANTILNTGRSDLQNQLAQLINTNQWATNANLGVQGIAANNAYQNAVTRNQQLATNTSNLINLGLGGIQGLMGMGAGGTGLPAGADVSSPAYMQNAGAIGAETLGY